MPYIQLSTLPLPASSDPGIVFPYLFRRPPENDEAGDRYSLALLVANANAAAARVVSLLGFQPDGATTAPLASWRFHRLGPGGPFLPLSDDPGADEARKLETYLAIELPDDADGDVIQPASLHVVRAALSPDALNGGFASRGLGLALLGMKRAGGRPDGWSLRFAETSDTDDVAAGFALPTVASNVPGVGRVEVDLTLEPKPADGGSWTGATLRVDDVQVWGTDVSRVEFGDGAILVDGSALSLELFPSEAPSLPVGPGGLARFVLPRESSAIRLSDDRVAVHLLPDFAGEDVPLIVDLDFSLIMSGPQNPDALAVLLPAKGRLAPPGESLDQAPQRFRHRLEFRVPGAWPFRNEPVVSLPTTSGARWSWDAFLDAANGWSFAARELRPSAFLFDGLRWTLANLLGDLLGPVSLELASPRTRRTPGANAPPAAFDGLLRLPLALTLIMAGQRLQLDFMVELDLKTLRLRTNALKFQLGAGLHRMEEQAIDIGFLALIFPSGSGRSTETLGGTLDVDARTFKLTAPRGASGPVAGPSVLVPGGLTDDRIDNRVVLRLEEFDPERYGTNATPENLLFLRIAPEGVSFRAVVDVKHVPKIDTGGGKPLEVRLAERRDGVRSEVVVVNDTLRHALLMGDIDVPAVDDLKAKVTLAVRQERRGRPPIIDVEIDLDKSGGAPLAQFSVGYLQLRLDDLRMKMSWDLGRGDWSLSVRVDGRVSLSPSISRSGGLDYLRKDDAIVVRDLDLLNLHRGPGSVELRLERAVEFEFLDGLFLVRFEQLRFGWGSGFFLSCELASFLYRDPGVLTVQVQAGQVRLEFGGGNQVKLRTPSMIDVDVSIGGAARFRGQIACVDNDVERYFGAAGTLELQGLPEAKALLKLGSGVKQNGGVVPNIVFYGAVDTKTPLFAGVVAKSFGAGIGINNRLAGIGERPNAEQMLANIDRIDPSRLENWEFVRRNGFFLSIVGATILTPDEGENDQVSAYVAALVLSLDLDLNVVAAGKVWFSSSVDFVRRPDHWNRPALVGAIALRPRDRVISAALQSRQNPAIEENDRLRRILENGRIDFAFVMSPRLVDFHLREIFYRDEFLGAEMQYRGSFRMAVLDGTVMLLMRQMICGRFAPRPLEGGCGGFSAAGDLAVSLELGGLLGRSGLAAYGRLAVQIALQTNAYYRHEWSVTIRLGRWKRKFSFSVRFDLLQFRAGLGLDGTAAFNESGRFGFDGTLSISVPIASFRLDISPSLKFNDGVIGEVRSRVAAFEARVEAVRREVLGLRTLEGTSQAAFALSAPTERWLHYEVGGWHLLLPRSDSRWFTPVVAEDASTNPDDPPPFVDHVTSIRVARVSEDGEAELLADVRPPWVRENRALLPADEREEMTDALDMVEAMMMESASLGDEIQAKPLSAYLPKRDPRVESAGHEWSTDEDRATLPDFVLPTRSRSPDELLTGTGLPEDADSDYFRLIDFLAWSDRAARLRRQRAVDQNDRERPLMARGAVARIALDARRDADRSVAADPQAVISPELRAWTRREPLDDPRAWFGVWFRLPDDQPWSDDLTVFVERRRADSDEPEISTPSVSSPADDMAAVRSSVRPLWGRQEYAVDRAGGSAREAERGRVVVKIPVLVPDDVLGERLPSISHWQLWRRMPGETSPSLVTDHQQPSLTYLDGADGRPDVVVVAPYVFIDEFPTADGAFVAPGLVSGRSEVRYSVKPIAVGDDSPPDPSGAIPLPLPVRPYIPPPDPFPAGLMMIWPAGSLYFGPTTESPDWGRFALAVSGDGEDEGRPRPATVTDDLGGRRPIAATDFEIWAEELDVPASGFYGDGDPQAGGGDAPPSGAAALDALRPERGPDEGRETTHGRRFRFDVVDDERAAATGVGFRIADASVSLFRSEFAYRFAVRPRIARPGSTEATAIGLLRPLTTFLTRDRAPGSAIARDSGGALGLRPALLVEFVPIATVRSIRAGRLRTVPVTISERPLAPELAGRSPTLVRARVGLDWDMSRADRSEPGDVTGGVELFIRDVDDSVVGARLLCETPDESAFRILTPDFRNSSAWQPTPRELALRLGFEFAPGLRDFGPIVPERILDQFLHIDVNRNPILRGLLRRMDDLTTVVRRSADPRTPASWWDVSPEAKDALTALRDFQRSPLNLDDPLFRDSSARLIFLVKHLFTGLRDEAAGLPDAGRRRALDDWLIAWLAEAEGASVESLPDPGDGDEGEREARRAYLDLDLARRLAAVVRRRLALAEEVVSASDPDDLLIAADLADGPSRLPGEARFEALRLQVAAYSQEFGPLDRCRRLLERMPSPGPGRAVVWAAGLLPDSVTELGKLARFDLEFPARRPRAAGVVGQAAGLTLAVNRLRDLLAERGWRFARRPHHQVAVGRDADDAKTARPTPLADLLPDDLRLDAALGRAPSRDADPAAGVASLLNVLERMGFALDFAVHDALGRTVAQFDLIRVVEEADIPETLAQAVDQPGSNLQPHQTWLIVGREPDSEHRGDLPDPPGGAESFYVGHSFAKLIVVPEEFRDLLRARLWPSPIDSDDDRDTAGRALVRLKAWLDARGVRLGDSEADEQQAARRVGHVFSFTTHGSDPAAVSRVRLEVKQVGRSTIPLVDGRAHTTWELPDRRGRRLAGPVIGRLVSRYEPLVKWAESLPDLDAPATLPDAAPEEAFAIRRIASAEDRGVDFDLPEPLSVAVHPDPRLIRFSFSLPAAGARSIYNSVSSVRTGYAGYTLGFRFRLRDHDDPEIRGWEELLAAALFQPFEDDGAGRIPDPPAIARIMPRSAATRPRLFRHERLVALDRLPYFFEYWMEARSQYDLRWIGEAPRPLDPIVTQPARREPGLIACRTIVLERVDHDDEFDSWQARIPLTRTGDLIEPVELAASPPLAPIRVEIELPDGDRLALDLPPDRLPDPSLEYSFFHRVDESGGAGNDGVYIHLAEVLMPWHPAYQPPDQAPPRPWFRSLDSRVVVEQDDERPPIVCGQSDRADPSGRLVVAYQIEVRFRTLREAIHADQPDRWVFQVTRNGQTSAVLPIDVRVE